MPFKWEQDLRNMSGNDFIFLDALKCIEVISETARDPNLGVGHFISEYVRNR